MTGRSTTSRRAAARAACAVAAALAFGNAVAQSLPKEGNYDYTSCWSGTSNDIQFSKTMIAGTFEYVTNNRSNPPGGVFDMTAGRCAGVYSMIDGKFSYSSYCEAVDKDGDKFMARNSGEGPRGKIDVIAGTGKYEGMVRTGSSESVGPFPSVKPGAITGCARQTGTYKLK